MAAGDLTAAAEAVRDAAAAGLGGRVLDVPPFVTHGAPVLDCCRVLSVRIAAVEPQDTRNSGGALGAQRRMQQGIVLLATFVVTVGDCYPVQADPTDVARYESAAADAADRAWAVYNHVMTELQAETLFPAGCRWKGLGALTPLDPGGGCIQWTFVVTAQIDGGE